MRHDPQDVDRLGIEVNRSNQAMSIVLDIEDVHSSSALDRNGIYIIKGCLQFRWGVPLAVPHGFQPVSQRRFGSWITC